MNKLRGICHINIGGKERGLVFNMNTYAIFCEGLDITLDEMENVFNSSKQARAFTWLIYSGLASYCESKNEEPDFTINDLWDWVIDVSAEDSNKIMETMLRSRELKNDSNNGLKRNVVDQVKEDAKKN